MIRKYKTYLCRNCLLEHFNSLLNLRNFNEYFLTVGVRIAIQLWMFIILKKVEVEFQTDCYEYLLLIIVVIRWDKSHPGDLNNTHIHKSE